MNYCNKCGLCCINIPINKKTGEMYRDGVQTINGTFFSMLIYQNSDDDFDYYTCKYLKNNLCTNPNKPDMCSQYPSSAFAYIPDDCGYQGVVFRNREKIMQKIRRLKEEIIHYNSIISVSDNKSEKQQCNKIIESHNRYISKYKQYGSDDW